MNEYEIPIRQGYHRSIIHQEFDINKDIIDRIKSVQLKS